ncbi:MAG: hypothetical protein BRD40_04730 [Bacteroidetes bacterium QS_1_65_9]|nr:MAG: hypothetical protein BRD40_04730 [Bacteroidetes bacterium QS_1_65_9]
MRLLLGAVERARLSEMDLRRPRRQLLARLRSAAIGFIGYLPFFALELHASGSLFSPSGEPLPLRLGEE